MRNGDFATIDRTPYNRKNTYLHSCSLPHSADAAFFAAYRRNCLGQACTFCPPRALLPKKPFLTLPYERAGECVHRYTGYGYFRRP
jgi:hypothetical protein